LQLRGHALLHPAAHGACLRAVCAAARSEIREPNAGIGRITSFSSSAQPAHELGEIVWQPIGTIDRQDRQAFLPATRIAL